MAAQITVIVPTLNAEKTLSGCLEALMEGLTAGLIRELIVTDGGSSDITCKIADEAGAVVLSGPASRGGQLRRAGARAQGKWLLILHADTELEQGWSRVVSDYLEENSGPAYFRLGFRAHGVMPSWVAGWANVRSGVFGLPYGDQGLLVQRLHYEQAGGYPDQPLMEDVALIRALRPSLTGLPIRAITGAERYQRAGWLRRGARNIWTLGRYLIGTDPEQLAQAYRR